MSSLVVDANIVVRLIVEHPGSESAESVLYADDDRLIAPDICWAEVTNVAWKWVRCGWRSASEASQLLEALSQFPVTWVEDRLLAPSAFKLAVELGHPAYDCCYLALALAEGCSLVTADTRLANAAERGGLGHHIRLLSSMPDD